jgi:hypothetical protein
VKDIKTGKFKVLPLNKVKKGRRTQKKILEIQGGISLRQDWDYKKDRISREPCR